ncbi:MAG: Crp/Fnr family transcriptional regulator [Acidimicrobiales bacterium]
MPDLQLLRSVALFADLTDDELAALAQTVESRKFVRNDMLFAEGSEPTELFVVVAGRVAISSKSIDGRESMFALMERGDLFGEMGLFDEHGRSADARALEPSQAMVVPYAPLRTMYERRPSLLWGVVRLLAGRLRSTDVALSDAVFLDVTGRTAKRLLELAGDTDEFTLPITQEELAGMVGASRERVNKAIASFVRLGWLDQADRQYRFLKRDELERRAR